MYFLQYTRSIYRQYFLDDTTKNMIGEGIPGAFTQSLFTTATAWKKRTAVHKKGGDLKRKHGKVMVKKESEYDENFTYI